MFFSMNFDAAAEQWMTPLCGGGAIVLSAAQDLAGATFVKLMMTHGVTTLHLPPAYLRLLLPMMDGNRSSVRTCIAGGEAWYATDLAATRDAFPGARLVNAYGPTETVITPAAWVGDASTPLESDYAPIGGPVGARRLYVLDAELNLVPQGAVGELYVGGLGLARGYLNNPALTADRFVADPFGSDGGRLYRTGDLVRWRSDGHLEYMGRLDHQIKIRGFRVELGEIEAQLLAQTGVREAVVLAHETRNGKTLLAYVAAHAGVLLTPSLLRASLGDALPDYMIPSQFVFLEALPLGPNGKINRKALPLPEQSGEQDYAPPVSAIEVIISDIWAEVLEVPQVGLHHNFFDLGGHSLLLIRVQSSLEKRLNAHIPIIELFKHTTVASLARLLGEETPAQLALQRHQERAQRQRGAFIQRKRKAGRSY
jgi:acyl-coenzyme A synthetase/AMP-(fatty) acid ligase/acyl carrier protein